MPWVLIPYLLKMIVLAAIGFVVVVGAFSLMFFIVVPDMCERKIKYPFLWLLGLIVLAVIEGVLFYLWF